MSLVRCLAKLASSRMVIGQKICMTIGVPCWATYRNGAEVATIVVVIILTFGLNQRRHTTSIPMAESPASSTEGSLIVMLLSPRLVILSFCKK